MSFNPLNSVRNIVGGFFTPTRDQAPNAQQNQQQRASQQLQHPQQHLQQEPNYDHYVHDPNGILPVYPPVDEWTTLDREVKAQEREVQLDMDAMLNEACTYQANNLERIRIQNERECEEVLATSVLMLEKIAKKLKVKTPQVKEVSRKTHTNLRVRDHAINSAQYLHAIASARNIKTDALPSSTGFYQRPFDYNIRVSRELMSNSFPTGAAPVLTIEDAIIRVRTANNSPNQSVHSSRAPSVNETPVRRTYVAPSAPPAPRNSPRARTEPQLSLEDIRRIMREETQRAIQEAREQEEAEEIEEDGDYVDDPVIEEITHE